MYLSSTRRCFGLKAILVAQCYGSLVERQVSDLSCGTRFLSGQLLAAPTQMKAGPRLAKYWSYAGRQRYMWLYAS